MVTKNLAGKILLATIRNIDTMAVQKRLTAAEVEEWENTLEVLGIYPTYIKTSGSYTAVYHW